MDRFKVAAQNTAKDVASYVGNYIKELPNPETPSYKISAGASLFLGLLSAASYVECGGHSTYLSLLGTAFSAGMAVNQYGPQKTMDLVSSTVSNCLQTFFKKSPSVANPSEEPGQELTSLRKRS